MCNNIKPIVLVDNQNNIQIILNIISEHKYHPSILKIANKMRFKKFNAPTDPFLSG